MLKECREVLLREQSARPKSNAWCLLHIQFKLALCQQPVQELDLSRDVSARLTTQHDTKNCVYASRYLFGVSVWSTSSYPCLCPTITATLTRALSTFSTAISVLRICCRWYCRRVWSLQLSSQAWLGCQCVRLGFAVGEGRGCFEGAERVMPQMA